MSKFFKKIGPKILLIGFIIAFVGFQTVFFSSGYTNKEFVEAQRQIQLLANLNLDKINATTYAINSQNDLAKLASFVSEGGNTSGLTFKQTQNITLSGSSGTSIGTLKNGFKGTYDGQNFAISNLNISVGTELGGIGLFAFTDGAIIQNVKISSGSVTSNKATMFAGALIGSANNTKLFHCFNLGCSVSLTQGSGKIYVGGLVGAMSSGATTDDKRNADYRVEQCYNSGTVTASNSGEPYAGGIVGHATKIYFHDSMNVGSVTATDSAYTKDQYAIAGGIVGYSSDCAFWSEVNGGSVYAKGAGSTTTTNGSETTGRVSESRVKYKYIATNIVQAQYSSIAGGISGWIADVAGNSLTVSFTNCINNGSISAPTYRNSANLSIISYVDDTTGSLDRYDFVDSTGNQGVYVNSDLAFQIGYNEAKANLGSCYYLEKTSGIKKGLNMKNAYKYMVYSTTGTGLAGNGTNSPVPIDTTLSVSNYSRYNNFSALQTADKNALNSRSSSSTEFTLTKTWCDAHKTAYEYLTSASIEWGSSMGMMSLNLNYSGAYHGTEGRWPFKKDVAKTFNTNHVMLYFIVLDLESTGINCTGNSQIQKTDAMVNTLGSTYWTTDPNINNGYPFLKYFTWAANAQQPEIRD